MWAVAAVTIALCVLSPLRQLSSDTVGGRMGGATLRCGHDFDLGRIDWIDVVDRQGQYYDFTRHDHAQQITSVFGPAPAVAGSVALLDFGEGDSLSDAVLRRRERDAAAVLLAISAALLAIACRARTTVLRSVAAAMIAVLSFAGAASLGQGLWQATTALPFLVGALAVLAHRSTHPRAALATPALALVAAMIRPTILPLALAIGVAWAWQTRERRSWLIAIALALVAATPLVVWNAIHYNSPFPLGQYFANRDNPGAFGVGPSLVGVGGLLVSPARGLVWFAPIAIAGAIAGWRKHRALAIGVIAQLVVMATFSKWHGGQAYGPRLLAEAVWIALFLAVELRLGLLAPLAALTILVGQLGLWCFTPEQWETRRRPEAHPGAFWDVVDSPIAATFGHATGEPAYDSTPAVVIRCVRGKILTR